MTGASNEADGLTGLVPQPLKGQHNFFLRGDGTWAATGVEELSTLVGLPGKNGEASSGIFALLDNKADSSKVESIESKLLGLIGEDENKTVKEIALETLQQTLIPEDADENLDSLEEIAEMIQDYPKETAEIKTNIQSLYEIVNGDGKGSINARIEESFYKFITNETDDGVINSYKELIDYVATHGGEVSEIISDINELKELTETYEYVEYEVAHKPVGTLVNYLDKEIRIMCPKDTEWTFQNPGANGDKNHHYIGFRAYAPAEAHSFKEDMGEIIMDNTMHYFENNSFAGIDEFGRKYSLMWLAVARYQDGKWTYYGANSTAKKFIGWTYSVEWYNEEGLLIHADSIRINLSNESCHTSLEKYLNTNNLIQTDWLLLSGGDADDSDEVFY